MLDRTLEHEGEEPALSQGPTPTKVGFPPDGPEGLSLVWLNRQKMVGKLDLQLPQVISVVQSAFSLVQIAATPKTVLPQLSEISFVLVSDRRIAWVHRKFMGDPTPTDVITFLHGEIVLSVETARREALERRIPLPEEVARYAVHGLLHLGGWTDFGSTAATMTAMQEKILQRALGGLC